VLIINVWRFMIKKDKRVILLKVPTLDEKSNKLGRKVFI